MHTTHLGPRRSIAVALVGVALASCANRPVTEAGASASSSEVIAGPAPVGGPTIDWEQPYGDSPTYPSIDAAAKDLSFTPAVPAFGKPDLIQLTPAGAPTDPPRMMVMVFHLPVEGTVMVEESATENLTKASLEAIVEARVAEGRGGIYEMVPLKGTQAMLVHAHGIGRMIWIQGDVRIDMTGPKITPAEVVALAAGF